MLRKRHKKSAGLPRYYRRTTRLTAGVTIKLKELVSCRHVTNEFNVSVTTVQCILMDGITGELVDILPNRDTRTLINYSKNKNTDTVRFLVSNMLKHYQELYLTVFKKEKHIFDKYPVIRQVLWVMEAVCKETQKKLNKHSRIRDKHNG